MCPSFPVPGLHCRKLETLADAVEEVSTSFRQMQQEAMASLLRIPNWGEGEIGEEEEEVEDEDEEEEFCTIAGAASDDDAENRVAFCCVVIGVPTGPVWSVLGPSTGPGWPTLALGSTAAVLVNEEEDEELPVEGPVPRKDCPGIGQAGAGQYWLAAMAPFMRGEPAAAQLVLANVPVAALLAGAVAPGHALGGGNDGIVVLLLWGGVSPKKDFDSVAIFMFENVAFGVEDRVEAAEFEFAEGKLNEEVAPPHPHAPALNDDAAEEDALLEGCLLVPEIRRSNPPPTIRVPAGGTELNVEGAEN